MRKVLFAIMILTMSLGLAACGAEKTELSTGMDLYRAGDCDSATPYLDATIADPINTMDMAYAYYLKGQCAKKAGDIAKAYEYTYAAKRVTCYDVGQEPRGNYNTIARSEYCQRILPKALSELEPQLEAGQADTIKAKVEEELNARYMQRFEKRLSQ